MNKKKDSTRKSKHEKPPGGGKEGRIGKGKDSKKARLNKRKSTPDQAIPSFPDQTFDKLEASCSFAEGNPICKKECPGVSIKDVGLDIAGFLIEEEIRKNKEKLKLEIVRQIALSKELDKHLARQRNIMNHYIKHNSMEGGCPAKMMRNISEKCNCMVCREAAREDACRCSRKPVCLDKAIHARKSKGSFRNTYSQSSPLTRDVSCQELEKCQECNSSRKSLPCNSAPANRYSTTQTPAACCDAFVQSSPRNQVDQSSQSCKCIQTYRCAQTDFLDDQRDAATEVTDQMLCSLSNILNTPLDTIKPQCPMQRHGREDATEMILSNIKNIIRDYMENINTKCTTFKSEHRTGDDKRIRGKNSNDVSFKQDVKSDLSTKCENDGTHIDIVMQFCEKNKKKRAILEIEPIFDERKCMKYGRKKSSHDYEMHTIESFGSRDTCDSSRRFNPYRPRHQVNCKYSHRCRQRKGAGMCSYKRKSHIPSIMYKDVSGHSSNESVKLIKVNRYNSKPSTGRPSSSSDTCDEKTYKSRKSNLKKHTRGKSAFCSYVSNVVDYPHDRYRHKKRRTSHSHISKHKKQDRKSSKKTNHQSHKANQVVAPNPQPEYTKINTEHEKVKQLCSAESSNLDETSYKNIPLYQKLKSSTKKAATFKTASTTCTTVSLNRENSKINVPKKKYSKKDNETTLCSYPSDILSSVCPVTEQRSITTKVDKAKTLHSSKVLSDNKATKLRNTNNTNQYKNAIHEASTSSISSFGRYEITPKQRPNLKTETLSNSNEVESDFSDEEIQAIDDLSSYPKICSDGGVVVLPPLFKTKRIQLIQKWLSYMNKLQENASNDLKVSAFGNFMKTSDSENSIKKSFYCMQNTQNTTGENSNSYKYTTLQKVKHAEPIKKSNMKQMNKKGGMDLKKFKSEMLSTDSFTSSVYNIIGSSVSDSSLKSTSDSLLGGHENNHDELILDLICPLRESFKGKYFNVNETDRLINRAFYIQDIFVNLANTEEEKTYWRNTVLRAIKNIVTNAS